MSLVDLGSQLSIFHYCGQTKNFRNADVECQINHKLQSICMTQPFSGLHKIP